MELQQPPATSLKALKAPAAAAPPGFKMDPRRTFLQALSLCLLLALSPPWCLVTQFVAATPAAGEKQVHIVYMGARPPLPLSSSNDLRAVHMSHLTTTVGSEDDAAAAHLYSYTNSFNGFSALLDPDHVEAMKQMEGVVSVFPSRMRSLATTRSWEFLGLPESTSSNQPRLWPRANHGRGVIVGMIDSGIWPESKSFRDDLMAPPPARWKGICESGEQFNSSYCNRKLIGARSFLKGFESSGGRFDGYHSPRDDSGHGTHTASIAAGRPVKASQDGLASGVARGGAPSAHVAVYKACWGVYLACDDADLLAAIDTALDDGVDILSMSVQNTNPQPGYMIDTVAIGSFHAIAKGVFVAAAAGNAGLDGPATASNLAPWITTVAASSLDRTFSSLIIGGPKGPKATGTLLTRLTEVRVWLPTKRLPLVYGGSIPNINATSEESKYCNPKHLDSRRLNGSQILLCEFHENSFRTNFDAMPIAGFILIGSLTSKIVEGYIFQKPAMDVTPHVGAQLRQLAQSSNNSAYVTIFPPQSDVERVKPAPLMASFSSTGPNSLSANILKPDIAAPGLNILAAWSPGASQFDGTNIPRDYSLVSGTSMACPHVTGVAILLKALYPKWSPAAIRSAIMTTASHIDNTGQIIKNTLLEPSNSFAFGSGQVQPKKATDPGLIYDIEMNDYLIFLCNDGLTDSEIMKISQASISCKSIQSIGKELNYPSIAAIVPNTFNVTRTLTNVGPASKVNYKVTIEPPKGVNVTVVPSTLRFQHIGEKLDFRVIFNVNEDSKGEYIFGWMKWEDGRHVVRSPIAIHAIKF